MAPTATSNPPIPEDTAGSLLNNTMALTTQVVNGRLEQLLNVVSSPSTGNTEIDRSLDQIRQDLESLTSTQSTEQDEIKRLLEDALNTEVLEYLTKEIERQIDTCVDGMVPKLVESELNAYVPRELRDRIDEQRSELLSLQVEIHNSEAKRANSFVKTQKHFSEELHHILDSKGHASSDFPKTVNDLLGFDDPKVLQLVKYYGNPEPKSKIQNLNWFLREIGVTYQSDLLG